ncbi:MAG: HD domain-containing protein [Desulfobacterales bacterium]|nr:HD domain-containing protein [Desulfobacterales bacterium]
MSKTDSTKSIKSEINDTCHSASSFFVENVKLLAKKLFDGAKGSHDWDHTMRAYKLSKHIGAAEGADMDVLLIAACLHDIGRCYQDESFGSVCHAEKGAQMAWPIVKDLPLTESQKENIIHCIKSHRFRGNHATRTLEAQVLFDADKLDSIGAVGVARAFLFAGEVGARLHSPEVSVEDSRPYSKDDTGFREFMVKLSKIKDKIQTKEGRKIAEERHDFMERFFKRFLEEYEGER